VSQWQDARTARTQSYGVAIDAGWIGHVLPEYAGGNAGQPRAC